ncbi:flagellar export chaperone FliS [Psychrobium sp. 1_MG-2023]|uniref:flagellar export chaperone FliS n=1 Tax=Psychrobium sp. 1_MG-2023 TaxID=3062624 RepID=UPI000C32C842|nr:flagellar export chaperone FliS [Psychrobium sp. 1_MG-2023]MDP2559843.1 flagellar export chaperone FliS [Psychrobium sp. 1_MG-2023]PKF59053.1 flagellar export chaperone FliS [Alteromonadales bacterium alter-6D02]
MTRLSIKKYRQASVNTKAEESPYQLVLEIFKQVLGNIAAAKGAIAQNDIEKRNELLNKAITLIGVLDGSLDFDQGGDISNNLASLYEYVIQLLFKANANNSDAELDEAIQLLLPLRSAWEQIPTEEQNKVDFSE